MPWLTPDSIPEDDDCRPLSIPADSVWLALVSGALTELTLPYNWEKFGTLTVQETVDKMQSIIDTYYNTPCATCTVPGGYRVVRISSSGHVQELSPTGEWQDATGDYLIPPPDARTGGTAVDQNCLAAKNATEVLSQLYESLSESFSSELSTDEALVAFIAAAVAAIGFEFAPITFAIAAVAFIIFEALFQALQYITADLWTEEFSAEFTCLLLKCAINTDGVVTFDWDCFNAALLAQVNDMGLSEVQMRLYVQIGYMLYFIGGVDGLNLAARTTSITDDDCSECACTGTSVNFGLSNQGFSATLGTYATDIFGTGWYAETSGGQNKIAISGDVEKVCGNGLNFNIVLSAGMPTAPEIVFTVVTGSQTKHATFTPANGVNNAHWDEGGELDPDSGSVSITYVGASGFGAMISSFQTGDV